MRVGTLVALLAAGWFTVGLPGVAGPARADAASTTVTDDGYGVQIGPADAAVRLEIFCEPQCPVCAGFEDASSNRLIGELGTHRLAVTYRWLTFLDQRRPGDTSARVSNALMLAADPATDPIAYQHFVGELYRHQAPKGADGPTADEIAAMARTSGIPGPVADRIEASEPAVNTAAMNDANHKRITRVNPQNPGTPTVYDLNTNKVVDTDEAGWLDRLMQAG